MTLPNFLIIGAPKCGTTSLYAYLKQHPQVFMTIPKEPTFFGNEGTDGLFNGPHDEDRAYHSRVITNFADYKALYDRVTNEKAIGEASIYYLYLPKAPEQIQKYVPKAAMFAVLRNPADRAYSAYTHVVRQARERRSFADSLREEPERIRKKWNGVVIAEATSGRCAACQIVLRPQYLQDLKKGDHLMTCESCGRFLYYNPPVRVEMTPTA